ncbi:hypothetical protein HK097_001381 [Rhizophlyctis rosea]|uniref:Uncharacterized protein n=1 Tax=Rhizophlyctis rosea TaxID=64517 RepID=A0AAD5S4G2_9FUNG|nr:hypothetical protein HK097_001381 [Rhizophlyctis rosea]
METFDLVVPREGKTPVTLKSLDWASIQRIAEMKGFNVVVYIPSNSNEDIAAYPIEYSRPPHNNTGHLELRALGTDAVQALKIVYEGIAAEHANQLMQEEENAAPPPPSAASVPLPAVSPPAVSPPAVSPPAVSPPAVSPPADQPPAVQPPADQPPAIQPPAAQSPAAPPIPTPQAPLPIPAPQAPPPVALTDAPPPVAVLPAGPDNEEERHMVRVGRKLVGLTVAEMFAKLSTEIGELRAEVRGMRSQLHTYSHNVARVHEIAAKADFVRFVERKFGVEILLPVTGKDLLKIRAFTQEQETNYLAIYNCLPDMPPNVPEERRRMFEQYGSVKNPLATTHEVDIVIKFRYKDVTEVAGARSYVSPSVSKADLAVEDAEERQRHQFHGIAVAEVSLSDAITSHADSFTCSFTTQADDITPSIMLVAKLLQLEREVNALNVYYKADVVRVAAVLSPSFRRTTGQVARSLLGKVFEGGAKSMPKLKSLHEKGMLYLIGT